MRQFRAISLVVLIALPGIGCFSFLQWQRSHVRHEVKEMVIHGMDRDSLTTLTFSADIVDTLLDWEHDREFEYAGEMYDIVEIQLHEDSITYFCWQDHEETRLNALLSSLTTSALDKDPANKSDRSKVTDILKVQYLVPGSDALNIVLASTRTIQMHSDSQRSRFLLPPPVPPPIST